MARRGFPTTVLLSFVLSALLLGCQADWAIEVWQHGQVLGAIDRRAWVTIAQDLGVEGQRGARVPLEQLLWRQGRISVDAVSLDGQALDWTEHHADTWVYADGLVTVAEERLRAERIEVLPALEVDQLQASIIDVAPTVAAALGLPPPAAAQGRVLENRPASQAAIILIDGLGYRLYDLVREEGGAPTLDGLGAPLLGHTVYASITTVACASLLTGAHPEASGVPVRGIRTTEAETILDVAARAGLRVVAVEGDALAFDLRGAEVLLSGDRDGDGHTDDNTYANARAVLSGGMPDLLWVHFHGIDDLSHTHGPYAQAVRDKIREVDGYIAELLQALPEGTLVAILSDHGQHTVSEDDRLGNHGTLLPEDMLIPIWIVYR